MTNKTVVTPLERWAIVEHRGSLSFARRALYQRHAGAVEANRYAFGILLEAENLLRKRIGTMAINIKTGKDFEFGSWVNLRLSDGEKAEIEHLAKSLDAPALLDWLSGMIYAGYSFSAAWDNWSNAQQVSLVCKNADDPNYGNGMSARHPDLDMAILTLQFKHVTVANGVWDSASPSPGGNSWG